MARTLTIDCDCGCGRTRVDGAPRPASWWLLEDQGRVMRTGPLDFASLACLARWLADPRLRQHPTMGADFAPETDQVIS